MAKPERRIVKPNPEGGWDVAARDAQRASAHYDKQADAINRARQILEVGRHDDDAATAQVVVQWFRQARAWGAGPIPDWSKCD